MHSKLIIEAFEKAKKEQGFNVKTHVTDFLSDYIFEHTKEPYGEKILRINYNKAISSTKEKVELKYFAAESLCHYIARQTYPEYLAENRTYGFQTKTKSFLKKHLLAILIIVLVILCGFTVMSSLTFNSQRWMIWKENHYEEVVFNTNKYNLGDLKLYKEERVEKFKKIKANCSTVFFKNNGTEQIWYGKNNKKELGFFTALGLHPKTGKTLKPITEYMIDKYICVKKKNQSPSK